MRRKIADVQKRWTTHQHYWACNFVRRIQHSRQVFLLVLSPFLFSLLLSSLLLQALFYERHVKHTGRIKWNTVEMLIVFFIRDENMRKRELLRSMGNNYFKGWIGCSVSTM